MSTKEEVIDWLRDAYAMERGLEIMLGKQAQNEDLHQSLRSQAQRHLQETRRHAEAVRACLEQMGSDTSTIKTAGWQLMETAKGMSTKFAQDERVKDLLAAYATEHFEIACYLALKAAAHAIGAVEVEAVCDSILPDEQRMATWLEQNLPVVVNDYLLETAVS